jgi:hypothetical protein
MTAAVAKSTVSPAVQKLLRALPSLRQNLYRLLVEIKKDQDWRKQDDSEDEPYIDVTIGCTINLGQGTISWNFQTGDNSFTGGAYGHPEWFTTSIMRRSNCKDLARELAGEIEDYIHEIASWTEAKQSTQPAP